jgi:peptidoglycan/LPS O-acetylase OafA/YrhL
MTGRLSFVETTKDLPYPTYSAAVDGLRGLAVLGLLLGILAGSGFPGSPTATCLLFVLTGYVVTAHMAGESRRFGQVDLAGMWTRRVTRWGPVAWITLVGVAALSFGGVWSVTQQQEIPGETLSSLLMVNNWWRLSSEVRLAQGPSAPLSMLWITSVVEQMVLLWSFVYAGVFILHRRGWRFAMPVALAVMLVGSVGVQWTERGSPLPTQLNTFARLGEFAMGAGLAWFWRRRGLRGPRRPELRSWVLRLWPIAAVALVVLGLLFGPTSTFWARGGTLIAGFCSLVLIAGAMTTGAFKELLEWPPVAWCGRRSGMVLFIAWPTYLAVPVAFGVVGRAVLVVIVTGAAMFAADYLPGHRVRSELLLASERDAGHPDGPDELESDNQQAY